jgi:uncharacterized membrane protein
LGIILQIFILRQVFRKKSYKGITALRIIGAIGAGMGLGAICVGLLFKFAQWKGANTNLYAGLIITLFVLIIALFRFFKNSSDFYKQIFMRIAIIGGLGLLLSFVSDLTIIKIQYRKHPEYIKTYEEYLKDPDN